MTDAPYLGELEHLLLLAIMQCADDAYTVPIRRMLAEKSGREIARGDRVRGMAEKQAEIVHQGVAYDVEVDTAGTESLECARTIAAHVG